MSSKPVFLARPGGRLQRTAAPLFDNFTNIADPHATAPKAKPRGASEKRASKKRADSSRAP